MNRTRARAAAALSTLAVLSVLGVNLVGASTALPLPVPPAVHAAFYAVFPAAFHRLPRVPYANTGWADQDARYLKSEDRRLSRDYLRLSNQVDGPIDGPIDGPTRVQLEAAQRAWIAFRNAQTEFDQAIGTEQREQREQAATVRTTVPALLPDRRESR